jgi:ureidoglycolate hydrolase
VGAQTERLALIARVLAQPVEYREGVWHEFVVPSRTSAAKDVDALCDEMMARAKRGTR